MANDLSISERVSFVAATGSMHRLCAITIQLQVVVSLLYLIKGLSDHASYEHVITRIFVGLAGKLKQLEKYNNELFRTI